MSLPDSIDFSIVPPALTSISAMEGHRGGAARASTTRGHLRRGVLVKTDETQYLPKDPADLSARSDNWDAAFEYAAKANGGRVWYVSIGHVKVE